MRTTNRQEREREREIERRRDGETERRRDGETGRRRDRETERRRDGETGRRGDAKTERRRDRKVDSLLCPSKLLGKLIQSLTKQFLLIQTSYMAYNTSIRKLDKIDISHVTKL